MSRHQDKWRLVGFLILTLALASACSRGASEENLLLGSENTLSGDAVLVCSQDCSDLALCGLVDEEKTVLLNSSNPSTINHDLAIRSGTRVSIDHQEMHPVIQLSDQSSFRAPFYQIFLDDGRSGWVSGWCIGQ